MLYQKINEKDVSRLVFGTSIDPMLKGDDVDDLLDYALSKGINTFDNARVYGKSEYSLGRWLKKQDREKIVVLSKGCHPSLFSRINEKAFWKDLEISLEALQTDYLDFYCLHRDDPKVPVGKIVEFLNSAYEKGLIREFGGSNWTYRRIQEANAYAKEHHLKPFGVTSPNFSLARMVHSPWGNGCVAVSMEEGAREGYRQNQMPLFSYSSMARGFFGKLTYENRENYKSVIDRFSIKAFYSEDNLERLKRAEGLAEKKNCSVSDIALAYLFHSGLNVFAIVSMTSKRRIDQNINSLTVDLTDDEVLYLNLEEKGTI